MSAKEDALARHLIETLEGSHACLYGPFSGAQAELLELNADAVDGAIQAVLAALASGLTWAEVRSRPAPLALLNQVRVHCLPGTQ